MKKAKNRLSTLAIFISKMQKTAHKKIVKLLLVIYEYSVRLGTEFRCVKRTIPVKSRLSRKKCVPIIIYEIFDFKHGIIIFL